MALRRQKKKKSDLTPNPVHFFPFQTDVIVNSVNPRDGLRAGTVSQSILQAAGIELEQEFSQNMTKTPQDSPLVLVTKGFKLSCKYVYHVLWHLEYSTRKLVRSR